MLGLFGTLLQDLVEKVCPETTPTSSAGERHGFLGDGNQLPRTRREDARIRISCAKELEHF